LGDKDIEEDFKNSPTIKDINPAATTITTTITAVPKGKLGGLKVKTYGAPVVPVIVESPVVDAMFGKELDVVVEEPSPMDVVDLDLDADADGNDDDTEKAKTALLTPPQSPRSPRLRGPAGFLNPRKRRGLTDPTASTATMDRRISLNPFRRGATLDANRQGDSNKDDPLSSTAEPQRRLSVAASLSNIRRSVVGTLSSASSSSSSRMAAGAAGAGAAGTSTSEPRGRRKFDVSRLPPSPTLPPPFRGGIGVGVPNMKGPRSASRTSGRSSGDAPSSPRQAVAPVVYSRGSILLEMSSIEDEETRMRTEMAFLG
jgi:hypothetical protein